MYENIVSITDMFAIVAIIVSIVSIYISVSIASKQNKIALLNERLEVMKKLENYVANLYSWEYNYGWFLKLSLTESQIKVLFNKKFADYFSHLDATSEKLEQLWGDYKHAKRKGDCNGRSQDDIENEIQLIARDELNELNVIKDKMYSKFMKI